MDRLLKCSTRPGSEGIESASVCQLRPRLTRGPDTVGVADVLREPTQRFPLCLFTCLGKRLRAARAECTCGRVAPSASVDRLAEEPSGRTFDLDANCDVDICRNVIAPETGDDPQPGIQALTTNDDDAPGTHRTQPLGPDRGVNCLNALKNVWQCFSHRGRKARPEIEQESMRGAVQI